jgi:peptidoglycan/LPS O-acetylase OafA/YrhL
MGVDISYGIYVYHMLVVNTLLTFRISGLNAGILTIFLTISMGILSWFIVEKPFLKLKTKKINETNTPILQNR